MNQTYFRDNQERERGRSRRKGNQPLKAGQFAKSGQSSDNRSGSGLKIALAAGCLAISLVAVGGVVYTYMGQQYRSVFFPNTTINGIDASGRTPEEVKEMIASQIKGYSLILETRQRTEEMIRGNDIGLHPEYDGTLEQILQEQEPLLWGLSILNETEYTIGTMVAYDQKLLDAAIDEMACMDPEALQAPVDAHISDYIEGVGYQIAAEEPGSLLNRDQVLAGVSDALLNLQERLNLEEIGAYEAPKILADDPELQMKLEEWNRYINVAVTYRFGEKQEVLDGSTIYQWLLDDGESGVILDESQVTQYVKDLAREYNTAYQPKTLKTSYGKTVTITGGPYGWRINQSAEIAALSEILHSGKSQSREPIYSQTANSHDGPDYGDTYVEINLTAQQLHFYKDGELLVKSDFVSGNESKGWATPAGAYPLTYKQRDATLRGENYETPVSYWMPFNGNIGMHDADWRNSFGGTIYKNGGSHGCVNLPPAAAKKIYENISAGMPVLCYHLDGSGSQSTSAAAKPTETTAAETTAAETKPAETTVEETTEAETKPAETHPAQSTTVTQPTPGTSIHTTPTPQPSSGVASAPGTGTSAGTVSGPAAEESRPSTGVVSGPGQ